MGSFVQRSSSSYGQVGGAGGPSLPTLVQGRWPAGHGISGNNIDSPIQEPLPAASLAGNCLIAVVNIDGSVSGPPTMTDNLSSSWGSPVIEQVGSQRISIFVLPNCSAGITRVIPSNAQQQLDYMHVCVYEFAGVALTSPVVTSAAATNTAPNINSGAINTGANNGCLIFSYGSMTGSSAAMTKWIAGTQLAGNTLPFSLLNAQNLNTTVDVASFAQFGIQTTGGSVTPDAQCNGNSTSGCQMLSIALKPQAGAGTSPAAQRIVTIQGCHYYGSNFGGSGAGPYTTHAPTRGNLIHLSWGELPASGSTGLNSMSDTAGNTYSTNGSPINNGSGGLMHQAKAQNATADTTNMLTFSADTLNAASVSHMEIYDVAGMPTSPFDTSNTTSGSQGSDTGTLTTVTYTPNFSNELVIECTGIDAHNLSGVSGAGLVSDIVDAANANGTGGAFESDDGFSHAWGVSSAKTWVYTIQHSSGGGVQAWESFVSGYKTS